MKSTAIFTCYLISTLIQSTIAAKSNDEKELVHKTKRERSNGLSGYEGDSNMFIEMVTSSMETVPWGVGEVLQDVDFWDTISPTESFKICIIGSGYDINHVDLPKAPDVIGRDASSVESWSVDLAGHGTHSAGTIAAIGDNDEGIRGIFPSNKGGKFQLVIGKTSMGSSHAKATLSSHIDAIKACVEEGAKVISTPMGNECFSERESKYFNKLYKDQGILIFAPAGDNGDESYTYPASLPPVVSVASSNQQRQWSGSQMNNQVELTAPGANIMSTLPNNKYAPWDGTAMATAHAAGVAGLLWMHFPDCTNSQIRNVLAKTALDLGATGCDDKFGHGLIQAKDAYDLLSQGGCGGDIGSADPVGGCHQLNSPVLSDSCVNDSDCDDSDPCTVDTCQSSVCSHDHDCTQCGLGNLVTVDITTDKYPEETTWEIIDYATNERVMAKNTSSYGNCDRLYSKSQCLSEGGYLFIIYDSELDGICCEYGRGRYEVTVAGERKVLGGEFEDTKSHFFHVKSNEPTTSPKPTSPKPPTESPNTAEPTKTWSPTISPTKSYAPTTLTCSSDSDCDDGDNCTDDTCVDSKCNFKLNCASCGLPGKITVDIVTDRAPDETSWEITDFYTYKQYMKSSSYDTPNHFYSSSKCFGPGSYVFSIYDSSDDGICCLYGQGSYTVSLGNKKLAVGGQFEGVEMHLLSIEDSIPTTDPRNDIPTWVPTSTDHPTLSPTSTYLPTSVPSISDSPSLSPSLAPTGAPSTEPSSKPSASPSDLPSDSPSLSPSISPTGVPSTEPSSKPSATPSYSPSDMPSDVPSDMPSTSPTTSQSPSVSSRPSQSCARAYEISLECAPQSKADPAKKCCPGLECVAIYCTPDCAREGIRAQECGATRGKQFCCEGRTCDEDGYCNFPDTCSKSGKPSTECGGWEAPFDKCCSGLVCQGTKCVDYKPCAKELENSKKCGGAYSLNDECCEGFTCEDEAGASKKCIRDPQAKCATVGKNSIECGAARTATKNIICCEGFICSEGSTRCKNKFAPRNGSSIACGDPDAASAECEAADYCDPLPGSTLCIKKLPCVNNNIKNVRECGAQWSKWGTCCEGFKCKGGWSKKCVPI